MVRARDLGIQVGLMETGTLNAITDVPGVRVGHSTIISGSQTPTGSAARTGVTVVQPHGGSAFRNMAPAAIEVLNGSGEITGRSQVDEYGYIETPIFTTNTFSVGAVHRAATEWLCETEPTLGTKHFVIPVIAETYDGFLNAIREQHVESHHVQEALSNASEGPVAEGNVGGGTGMALFQFKGGIGTASRKVNIDNESYVVGVLVQGNTGRRDDLVIGGAAIGREIFDLRPEPGNAALGDGSIIVIIATNAPLSDRQCRRLCKRGIMGLGRVGLTAGNSSGDLLLAFSNHRESLHDRFDSRAVRHFPMLNDNLLNPVFNAVVEATAESVLNALVSAETMTGVRGNILHGIPHDRLVSALANGAGNVI